MKLVNCLFCASAAAFTFNGSTYAQNIEELHQYAIEQQSAKAWNALAEKIYSERKKPELLKEATDKAIQLAKANNDSAQWGKALVYASDLLYQEGKFILYQKQNRTALKMLQSTQAYSIKETALNNIATSFGEQDQIDSLIHYTKKAMLLNYLHQGNKSTWGDECQNLSYAYSVLGIADSAYHYTRLTINALTAIKDTIRLLDAYNQMGVFYVKRKQYPDALSYFNKALNMYDLIDNKHNRLYIYTNLAAMYYKWGKKAEAVKFAHHALKDGLNTDENATYGKLLSNLGLYMYGNRQYQASIDTLRQALPYVNKSFYYLGSTYQTLANNYEAIHKTDSCEYFLDKVDSLANIHQFIRSELFYASKVSILMNRKEYKKAAEYARMFKNLDKTKELTECSPHIYNLISQTLELEGKDLRSALEYKKKAAAMQDTLYQQETNRRMVEYYTRYQTAQKDLKIAEMTIEQQQKEHYWMIAIGSSIFLVILLITLVLYQRIKRIKQEKEAADLYIRIQQKEQELDNLAKEMHTHILHSYFKGTEAERKRLAKELHDNVANELLGISMLMKIHPESNEEAAQHLKNLHEEVRAISHDLMPPVFRQLTLSELLRAHMGRLNNKENCKFELSLSNEDNLNTIKEEMSLAVYRIIQELTGNILKYASATLASVKIRMDSHNFFIDVSDNGIGFDTQKVTKGVGLQFIRNRVEELNGNFQLHTSIGNGCEIFITFPLNTTVERQ